MKHLRNYFTVAIFFCLIAVLSVLAACSDEGTNNGGKGDVVAVENGFVFVATEDVMDIGETTTLEQYMQAMQKNGGITFEAEDGMIVSVNGVTPSAQNEYWFIYTSLEDYSNTTWGTYSYNGQTLGSATLGFGTLPCVAGQTYALILSAY